MRLIYFDRSILFALLLRCWQTAAGAVSLIMITAFFSADLQGFYYTFSSLLGLQAFVELGLYIVVLVLASQEWSKLSLDDSRRIVGDAIAASRLASLVRFVAKWYFVASAVFAFGVGIAGHAFLSGSGNTHVEWGWPWWTVVALATCQLWLMPVLTLLEGCNQVAEINRFRFFQAFAESLALWCLLIAGAGLWAASGPLAVKVISSVAFLSIRYRRFFASLWAFPISDSIDWKRDIWPMQWRLAAQGAVNYLVFSLFTPLMFKFHGPAVAGRMGMTLQIISVIQMISVIWVQTKLPSFGMLAAQRNFAELDKVWLRAAKISFLVQVVGSISAMSVLFAIHELELDIATRVLDIFPTALFLVAFTLFQIPGYQAAYLRAHAKEPFTMLGVFGGLINGGLVFVLGSRFGPSGAAIGFLATVILVMVPFGTLIWKRRRTEWQSTSPQI